MKRSSHSGQMPTEDSGGPVGSPLGTNGSSVIWSDFFCLTCFFDQFIEVFFETVFFLIC